MMSRVVQGSGSQVGILADDVSAIYKTTKIFTHRSVSTWSREEEKKKKKKKKKKAEEG